MNCPSRTDEPEGTGLNQSPNALAADLTTRQDFNGIANSRTLRRMPDFKNVNGVREGDPDNEMPSKGDSLAGTQGHVPSCISTFDGVEGVRASTRGWSNGIGSFRVANWFSRARGVVVKFGKFTGPGFIVCPFPLSNLEHS